MSDDSRYQVTEADRLEAERLERELVQRVMENHGDGSQPIWTSERFTTPIGLREDDTLQLALTDTERLHKAEVRRRTGGSE